MSITDELRKEAQGHLRYLYTSGQAKHLLAIADRIDKEHAELAAKSDRQREQLAAMEDALRRRNEGELKRRWQREIDALRDERDELRKAVRLSEAKASDMVELPKDADGTPIRVGDVMEWVPYDDTYQPVIRTVSGVGTDVFFAWSSEKCNYAQYDAQAYRHHKQPTVEDVLEQFAVEVERAGGVFEVADDVWTRFAAKLRLAGDAE